MRAIVLVDLDDEVNLKECYASMFIYQDTGSGRKLMDGNYYKDKVLLKPIPEKLDWKVGYCTLYNINYVDGWNNCIDEIIKVDILTERQKIAIGNKIKDMQKITNHEYCAISFHDKPVRHVKLYHMHVTKEEYDTITNVFTEYDDIFKIDKKYFLRDLL